MEQYNNAAEMKFFCTTLSDHFLNSIVNLGEKLDWELGRNLVHSGITDIRSKSFIMKEAK